MSGRGSHANPVCSNDICDEAVTSKLKEERKIKQLQDEVIEQIHKKRDASELKTAAVGRIVELEDELKNVILPLRNGTCKKSA